MTPRPDPATRIDRIAATMACTRCEGSGIEPAHQPMPQSRKDELIAEIRRIAARREAEREAEIVPLATRMAADLASGPPPNPEPLPNGRRSKATGVE